jgi:hypothetical protein
MPAKRCRRLRNPPIPRPDQRRNLQRAMHPKQAGALAARPALTRYGLVFTQGLPDLYHAQFPYIVKVEGRHERSRKF